MNIYESMDQNSDKWLDNKQLEQLLLKKLKGFAPPKSPVKTRKKIYKDEICRILEFEIPQRYKRAIKPSFPIMDFDVYIQQSDNVQIWNEDIPPTRRYVLIRVDENDAFMTLKVISGDILAKYDTTGKITTKLQAILSIKDITNSLINSIDTNCLIPYLGDTFDLANANPSNNPVSGQILPIKKIYQLLQPLINQTFIDPKTDRKRGEIVHKMCCQMLGYTNFSDNGQFPDIRHQLLEVKLQTSPTIDIGKENPTDTTNKSSELSLNISNKDIRYIIIYATGIDNLTIKNIIVVSGENFFNAFKKMEGNVVNGKIQLPLPKDFFH